MTDRGHLEAGVLDDEDVGGVEHDAEEEDEHGVHRGGHQRQEVAAMISSCLLPNSASD